MNGINIPNKRKVESNIDRSFDNALKNNEFKMIINKLKLSPDIIKLNVSKIEDTVEELKRCKGCKGLYECKNIFEGHVNFPENIDGNIRFIYTPCKFQKNIDQMTIDKKKTRNILDISRMKDIDITDKNRVVLVKWLKKFYDNYKLSNTSKGLYLHGSFGSGKTYLISCLFNELKEKNNITTEIVYYPDLLRDLKNDFNLVESKLNYLERVDLLLLDDIGAENVTAWGRDEILGTILQHRMNEGLTTFFTSNLNIKELESHLALTKNSDDQVKSRRIIERIKQLTEDIELISQNRRK